MKNSVSVILERIEGSALYYSIYTLNMPFGQGATYHFSDNITMLVVDYKERGQYLSRFLDQSRKYQYAASGIIRVIEDEAESAFILNGVENLIRKGRITESKVLKNILLLEEDASLFDGAVSAN
ncbi:hypothetical protein HNQ91_002318 [Filimonas zeae]|uniref:Uncharacterized protein n=1 Tax=Filimonas zeae TaxID=1737353 RepID=A0A917MW72_9BACT|nr:hypothetical protein [Filimonas zeae]MDR6339267.1 hypothetical protein [Filimonas zeae]GGH64374.1 hypothetical protein GCM10011379_16350 [Filimonas zeae]